MNTKTILVSVATFLVGAYAQKKFDVCGKIADGIEAGKEYFSKKSNDDTDNDEDAETDDK